MDWLLHDNGLRHERVKWFANNKILENVTKFYILLITNGKIEAAVTAYSQTEKLLGTTLET